MLDGAFGGAKCPVTGREEARFRRDTVKGSFCASNGPKERRGGNSHPAFVTCSLLTYTFPSELWIVL